MEQENVNVRLAQLVELCRNYCIAVENATATERDEFVISMVNYLPRIYWEFADLACDDSPESQTCEVDDYGYFASYVDEDQYEQVRGALAALMGEEDTYLETFEEDMKYSDTPIAASISENLADIYQPVMNFVESVKDGGTEMLVPAFQACKDDFIAYWGQTLCNVLRALHPLRFK